MTDRVRRLGLILGVSFCVLLATLTNIQFLGASKLNHDRNNHRGDTAAFSADRGAIQTADGVVIARSVPSAGQFKHQREYPEGPLYAPITGYVSFTYNSAGAEHVFNDDLGGAAATGDNSLSNLFNGPGNTTRDITLTIDSKVQHAAADALGGRRGAVVALNPTTGEVLALVTFPSYDPARLAAHNQPDVQASYAALSGDPQKPLTPRPYAESFIPGSTFKVITSSAAFDHAPDLTTKAYPRLSSLKVQGADNPIHNFANEVCGGTIADILRISCNSAFAQMGLDLGGDNLAAEAAAFGFGSAPPLDLDRPGAAPSRFPAPARFASDQLGKPGLAFSAIGQQDVSATPLQMALVASAIANGGVIMAPHVLHEVRDAKGNVVKTAPNKPWRTATSAATAAAVRDLMIGVVQRGTGTRAAIRGISVAAKTGTAQTGRDTAHAWMIAFAPADAPKVAVAVIVEDQPGLGDATGGRIAAPIVQAVIRAALGL